MGCDIHAYLERKEVGKTDNEWEFVHSGVWGGEVGIGRSYKLFGLLTQGQLRRGIPNELHALSPAIRGLPDDLSQEVADINYDPYCYHSASYITLEEIQSLRTEVEQLTVLNLIDDSWDAALTHLIMLLPPFEESPNQLHRYRLVFWFDS